MPSEDDIIPQLEVSEDMRSGGLQDSIGCLQALLVGSASKDPFATLVIDPRTGVSMWSHKGNEFQGNAVSQVHPLGYNLWLSQSLDVLIESQGFICPSAFL